MTRPIQRSTNFACTVLLGLAGCPDDGTGSDTIPQASGFVESTGAQTPGPDTTTTTPPVPTDDSADSGEPWEGTAFQGEVRGVLTMTFTPAHVLSNDDELGMAGGYRIPEVGWVGTEDLYSPVAYQLAFPTPPEQADTLLPAESLPLFDWGDDEDWLLAGNGMKLRAGEGGPEILACLLLAGDYPLYRTSNAMGVPAECAPDPTAWSASTPYDVVLYGGKLFEDNVLAERITTPPALVVTAPDLDAFNASVPANADLTIAWETGDSPDTRIIIRIVDDNTNVITVHAADDGEFTIPAAELGALVTGPIDLSIVRERTDRVQFTDGGLTVLSRYERWGFFDLF